MERAVSQIGMGYMKHTLCSIIELGRMFNTSCLHNVKGC